MADTLVQFIKEGKQAGLSHQELNDALTDAGWEQRRVKEALQKFADSHLPIAVPCPTTFASPRLVFLNLFAFILLYITVFDVIAILFTLLDYHLPDGLGRMHGMWKSSGPIAEALRGYLASVVICAPLFFWTSRLFRKAINQTKQRLPRMRLILIHLTLFIGACVVLCSGISFVYYFLSGELSLRFVLKVLILGSVVFGVSAYFRPEIKEQEKNA